MATYAVIENDTVVNLIVADTLEIAETVTGLTCVEFVAPAIGDRYENGAFVIIKPTNQYVIIDEVEVPVTDGNVIVE
jgi:hypothetical protein